MRSALLVALTFTLATGAIADCTYTLEHAQGGQGNWTAVDPVTVIAGQTGCTGITQLYSGYHSFQSVTCSEDGPGFSGGFVTPGDGQSHQFRSVGQSGQTCSVDLPDELTADPRPLLRALIGLACLGFGFWGYALGLRQ